jgi:comEA protein
LKQGSGGYNLFVAAHSVLTRETSALSREAAMGFTYFTHRWLLLTFVGAGGWHRSGAGASSQKIKKVIMKLMSKLNVTVGCLLAAFCLTGPVTNASAETTTTKTRVSTSTSKVDVNSADVKTLETLPGVGPSTAQKIVAGRPYSNAADLEKVKGLSKAKVDALKGQITFGPVATAKTSTKTERSVAATKSADAKTSSRATRQVENENQTKPNSSAPLAATGRLPAGEKININTASAEELDRLPGIGKTKAEAIVSYRNQNGSFKSIEDIEKVSGIKEGEFSKIKDSIKVRNLFVQDAGFHAAWDSASVGQSYRAGQFTMALRVLQSSAIEPFFRYCLAPWPKID